MFFSNDIKNIIFEKNEEYPDHLGCFKKTHLEFPHDNIENIIQILRLSSRFSIDVLPRLIYAKSDLVESLVTSGVNRYVDFNDISNILFIEKENEELILNEIPLTKSDIFKTSNLTLIEKRLLMRFITDCSTSPAFQTEAKLKGLTNTVNKLTINNTVYNNWNILLDSKKLTDRLKYYITYGICQCSEENAFDKEYGWNVNIGYEQLQKFVSSVGRFGNSQECIFIFSLRIG
eukprot:GHVL01019758.1.p2 GENE.GHVL01019758.1~~GHVL01019758.1.p2  ORF type:complete len:232 (+),score=50.25 GHVL01019758.1:202-897(+)